MSGVFVPVAFMRGLAGEMYRQIAVTIEALVMISLGFVEIVFR